MGFWSKYDLCEADWYPTLNPATIGYQRLHATQLELLYYITQKEVFKTYSKKFRNQDKLLNIIKMYKIKYRALKKIGRL
jgi:hypothetical protein